VQDQEFSMSNQPASTPEWSNRIRQLILKLSVSQAGLAARIGVSPATISRWMKGSHEPTSAAYIAMGNLAGSTSWSRPTTTAFPSMPPIPRSGAPSAQSSGGSQKTP
jgi:transcriptional regulator with XRE-family HTH domain